MKKVLQVTLFDNGNIGNRGADGILDLNKEQEEVRPCFPMMNG